MASCPRWLWRKRPLPDSAQLPPPEVHSSAIVHPGAKLAPGVKVGPFAVIGENIEVGEGTKIGAHVVLEGWTRIGRMNDIGVGAVIGSPPQDHKYDGGRTYVIIGDRNHIREYVTIHRPATLEASTNIGNDSFLMGSVHVAHDCKIGNHVTITQAVGLSGHIEVDDFANIGGMSAFHQFVRVGSYAMVGGHCTVRMDVVPYALATGEPFRIYGVNKIGLRRSGFKAEQIKAIKDAFRTLFWSGLTITAAVARLKTEMGGREDVARILKFVEKSKRGLTPGIRVLPGRNPETGGEEEA